MHWDQHLTQRRLLVTILNFNLSVFKNFVLEFRGNEISFQILGKIHNWQNQGKNSLLLPRVAFRSPRFHPRFHPGFCEFEVAEMINQQKQ